jgi:hypothetical protein
MDILWGASVLLSLAGGYLLILAVCMIPGLLLGIPAMLMRRAPYRQRRVAVPPMGRKDSLLAWVLAVLFALGLGGIGAVAEHLGWWH